MKKALLFIFNLILVFQLFGQQTPHIFGAEMSSTTINPATLPFAVKKYDHSTSVNALYRYQWTEIEGAPQTLVSNFNHFSEDYNFLLGGQFISDQTGQIGTLGLYLKGAYLIEFNRDLKMSIGGSAGLMQYRVDASEFIFFESGDIAMQNVVKFFPDFSLGAMVYFGESYFVGLSVPQTLSLNLDFRELDNDFSIRKVRHYYLHGGANFEMSNDSWLDVIAFTEFVPNAPLNISGKLRYEHEERFWFGGGGSYLGEFSIETGIITSFSDYKILKVGYEYSGFFTSYGPAFGGTHELRAAISWGR